jgi:hypothetical protein
MQEDLGMKVIKSFTRQRKMKSQEVEPLQLIDFYFCIKQ